MIATITASNFVEFLLQSEHYEELKDSAILGVESVWKSFDKGSVLSMYFEEYSNDNDDEIWRYIHDNEKLIFVNI